MLRGNDGLSILAIHDNNHHPPVIIWAVQDNNVIQKFPVRKSPLFWKLRRRPNVKYVLFETRFRRRWSVSNGKFRRREPNHLLVNVLNEKQNVTPKKCI